MNLWLGRESEKYPARRTFKECVKPFAINYTRFATPTTAAMPPMKKATRDAAE
jgi:hypothetical protein